MLWCLDHKMKKLKKLNEILCEGGPSFVKMKMVLEDWKQAYNKRGLLGDDSVIKFIEHLCDDGK